MVRYVVEVLSELPTCVVPVTGIAPKLPESNGQWGVKQAFFRSAAGMVPSSRRQVFPPSEVRAIPGDPLDPFGSKQRNPTFADAKPAPVHIPPKSSVHIAFVLPTCQVFPLSDEVQTLVNAIPPEALLPSTAQTKFPMEPQ